MNVLVLLQTLVVGAIGAGLAYWLYIPAPFLLGPAAFVTIAALCGLTVDIPAKLRNAGFVLVGLGLGSGVTPEILSAATRWPLSLVLLCAAVAVILWGGGAMLARLYRMDHNTSILAAAPGHLSYVLALGLDTKADLPLLTLIQSIRVLALTILTPPLVILVTGETLPRGLPPTEAMPLPLVLPLAALAAVVGLGFHRLKVPAAMLIGAMVVSSIGHGTGWTPGGMPHWLSIPGFVMMGSLIGARFSGITVLMMRRAAVGAAILTGLAVVVACAAGGLTSLILGFPLKNTLLAFAPGGVETMAAMALLMHGDPAYVALHHVVRLFALTALIPLALHKDA